MAVSKGVYSLYNGWLNKPEKEDIPELPDIKAEYEKLEKEAKACDTIEAIDNFLDKIYQMRQSSLLTDGEFGVGNLCFKELRNNNIIQNLKDKKVELENKDMSLTEARGDARVEPEIYNQLSDEEKAYVDSHDIFLNYDGDIIVYADWDYETEYKDIDELKSDLDYNIEAEKEFDDNFKFDDIQVDEAVIEEASEEDKKAKALAHYLDISVEAVEDTGDDEFDTPEGDYLVYSEDEAYQAAKDMIIDYIENDGLNIFSDSFIDEILESCLNYEAIDEFIDNEIEYYETQEQDEEMVEYLRSLEDSAQQLGYILNMLDPKTYKEWAAENIDKDKVAEEAIDWDGVEHFLAKYDDAELDLGNDLYAYRVG